MTLLRLLSQCTYDRMSIFVTCEKDFKKAPYEEKCQRISRKNGKRCECAMFSEGVREEVVFNIVEHCKIVSPTVFFGKYFDLFLLIRLF